MRTWITPVLMIAATLPAIAQPPSTPKQPGTIVITPKGRLADAPPAAPGEPIAAPDPDRPGFLVIRPGRPLPAQPPAPQPVPAAGPNTVSAVATLPAQPAPAAPAGQLFDYWFAAAVDGHRIGYLRWTAREVTKDGMTYLEGVKKQELTVARFGDRVTMTGEEGTTETFEAGVLVTSMRQGIGAGQSLTLTGVVDGKTLKVTGGGAAQGAQDTPWPGGVTGIAREPFLFREKKLKVGETFDYLSYVPQVNRVVKSTVTLEAEEALTLWPGTPPRKLLRYVSRMEPVGTFKLPPATTWCDAATFEPYLTQFKFPGLGGTVTFLRTTQEQALAPITGPIPDIFNVQSVKLDREIPQVHARGSAVYRVAMPDDDDPATAFPADARQQIKNLDKATKTFELHVSALRGPTAGAKPDPAPGAEYLGSSFFINSEDATVKAHAARAVAAVGPAASAWDRAKAIERWVHQNMRAVEFTQAMATADNVAKSLSGDCTEYAMLAAAMCRANGIPARTVLGLVYATMRDGRPVMAYHMWFEVYADNQWLPLDATLALGGVGPGHVKIAAHSWHDERSFAPLLPVLRVLMAKTTFAVVSASQ